TMCLACFFFSSRRLHTIFSRDWSSDVCSSDLAAPAVAPLRAAQPALRRRVRAAVADGAPDARLTRAARAGENPRVPPSPSSTTRTEERRVGKQRADECLTGVAQQKCSLLTPHE